MGLLQNYFINELLEFIEKNTNVNEYDSTNFACAISLPISQQIRAHSVILHLKEKFVEYYEQGNAD